MTDSTRGLTPAQRRYTARRLDQMKVFEFETEPFTDRELDQIDAYHGKIAGIPDTLDPDTVDALPEEWGCYETSCHFRAMLRMLEEWHQSIDCLRDELGQPLSRAAVNFLCAEVKAWQESREAHVSFIVGYLCGTDEDGYRLAPTLNCSHTQPGYSGAFTAEMEVLAPEL